MKIKNLLILFVGIASAAISLSTHAWTHKFINATKFDVSLNLNYMLCPGRLTKITIPPQGVHYNKAALCTLKQVTAYVQQGIVGGRQLAEVTETTPVKLDFNPKHKITLNTTGNITFIIFGPAKEFGSGKAYYGLIRLIGNHNMVIKNISTPLLY